MVRIKVMMFAIATFLISQNCMAWVMLKLDNGVIKCSPAPDRLDPNRMLSYATSEEGGFSDCKIKSPQNDKGIFIIKCTTPYQAWIFTKTLAKCAECQNQPKACAEKIYPIIKL